MNPLQDDENSFRPDINAHSRYLARNKPSVEQRFRTSHSSASTGNNLTSSKPRPNPSRVSAVAPTPTLTSSDKPFRSHSRKPADSIPSSPFSDCSNGSNELSVRDLEARLHTLWIANSTTILGNSSERRIRAAGVVRVVCALFQLGGGSFHMNTVGASERGIGELSEEDQELCNKFLRALSFPFPNPMRGNHSVTYDALLSVLKVVWLASVRKSPAAVAGSSDTEPGEESAHDNGNEEDEKYGGAHTADGTVEKHSSSDGDDNDKVTIKEIVEVEDDSSDEERNKEEEEDLLERCRALFRAQHSSLSPSSSSSSSSPSSHSTHKTNDDDAAAAHECDSAVNTSTSSATRRQLVSPLARHSPLVGPGNEGGIAASEKLAATDSGSGSESRLDGGRGGGRGEELESEAYVVRATPHLTKPRPLAFPSRRPVAEATTVSTEKKRQPARQHHDPFRECTFKPRINTYYRPPPPLPYDIPQTRKTAEASASAAAAVVSPSSSPTSVVQTRSASREKSTDSCETPQQRKRESSMSRGKPSTSPSSISPAGFERTVQRMREARGILASPAPDTGKSMAHTETHPQRKNHSPPQPTSPSPESSAVARRPVLTVPRPFSLTQREEAAASSTSASPSARYTGFAHTPPAKTAATAAAAESTTMKEMDGEVILWLEVELPCGEVRRLAVRRSSILSPSTQVRLFAAQHGLGEGEVQVLTQTVHRSLPKQRV